MANRLGGLPVAGALRYLTAIVVVLLLMLPMAGSARSDPSAPPASSPSATGPKPLLIIMDLSSSMDQDAGGGKSRLDGAKDAMINLLRKQPPDTKIGIWSYPGGGDSCSPGGYIPGAEMGTVHDPAALAATVGNLSAYGDTPTGDAMKAATESLRSSGETGATIVLVSDGESNCSNEPCETAKSLTAEGFAITVLPVGFQISDEGRAELQCLAAATGGEYYDAENSTQLSERLSELSVPALDLTVTAPTVTASGGQLEITATVTNTSATALEDVWVSLQFNTAEGGNSIAPVVIPPRQRLGTLHAKTDGQPNAVQLNASRASRTWLMSTGPSGTRSTMNWSVSAWSKSTYPQLKRGTINVTDKLDVGQGGQILKDILNSAQSAIVMGDSYSSGEGTKNYVAGDGTHAARCHRSNQQYAFQLLASAKNPKVRNLACSGAILADFISPQLGPSNGFNVPADWLVSNGQIQLLNQESAPSAVFLSIGGNDIGFAGIASKCLTSFNCAWDKDLESNVTQGLQNLDRLARNYQEIYRIINTSDRRNTRGGAIAPVVVLPYPKVLPPSERANCNDLSRKEVDYINIKIDQLNAKIRQQVRAATDNGAEVYYAAEVVHMAQPSNTMCDKAPYINPPNVIDGASATVIDWTIGAVSGGSSTSGATSEYVHPNVAGHHAEAASLISWSTSVGKRLPYKEFEPVFTLTSKGVGTPETSVDVTDAGRIATAVTGTAVRVGISTTICRVKLLCMARVLLESAPRVVANTVVEGGDEAAVDFVVPSDMPSGVHHLTLQVMQPDGSVTNHTVEIRVKNPLPWWFWGGVGLTGLALLVTVGAFWRVRRLR